MAWNGSVSQSKSSARRIVAKRTSNRRLWLSITIVAMVCIGLAIWQFAKFTNKGIIECAPESKWIATNKSSSASRAINSPTSTPQKLNTYIDNRGVERYEGGLRVVKYWPQPPQEQMNTNRHLFDNAAEFHIHGLLTTQPGTFMIDVKYNPRTFEQAFKDSLNHTIEILPDDTPDIAEQKRAVIAAKNTLRVAMERGENITEIMNDTRAELVRLNRYRDKLKETAAEELSKNGITDKDINDYIDAMNIMLRESGIREIQHKEFIRDILRYQRRVELIKSESNTRKSIQ